MDKGIIIMAIICGTVTLASVLNFVKWYIKPKATATLGGQITRAVGASLKDEDED